MLPTLLPIFSIIFLYFILQVKTRLETSQGVPPQPKGTVTSVMATPQDRHLTEPEKWDTKNIVHRSYSSQYGAFLPYFLICPFFLTRISLTFSQPIPPGAECLHMAPPPPRHWPQRPPGITIRTINIRYCRRFGLAQAIREVERGGFDVMLLTKTKIQSEAY